MSLLACRAMRTRVALAIAVLSTSLGACGGVVSSVSSKDAGPPNDGGPGADAPPAHAPSQHRSTATTCTPVPLPPEPNLDAGSLLGPSARFDCHVHTDCTAMPRGRCILVPTNPPYDPGGTRCVYDQCTTDMQCGPGPCQCGDVANSCLAGNCHVDSDCGNGGYCSPEIDPCQGFTLGYYCHTPADTCIDDTDCTNTPPIGRGSCQFDGDAGSWQCDPALCGA
jgi:hypothetical protein